MLYFVAWIHFMNSQYWVGMNLVTWHGAEVSDSFVYMFAYFSLCLQTKKKQNTSFCMTSQTLAITRTFKFPRDFNL